MRMLRLDVLSIVLIAGLMGGCCNCAPPELPELSCIPVAQAPAPCCAGCEHVPSEGSLCDPRWCAWPPEGHRFDTAQPSLTPAINQMTCCPGENLDFDYTWGPLDCLRYPGGRNGRPLD